MRNLERSSRRPRSFGGAPGTVADVDDGSDDGDVEVSSHVEEVGSDDEVSMFIAEESSEDNGGECSDGEDVVGDDVDSDERIGDDEEEDSDDDEEEEDEEEDSDDDEEEDDCDDDEEEGDSDDDEATESDGEGGGPSGARKRDRESSVEDGLPEKKAKLG